MEGYLPPSLPPLPGAWSHPCAGPYQPQLPSEITDSWKGVSCHEDKGKARGTSVPWPHTQPTHSPDQIKNASDCQQQNQTLMPKEKFPLEDHPYSNKIKLVNLKGNQP